LVLAQGDTIDFRATSAFGTSTYANSAEHTSFEIEET
jgi:hypothetical protein